MENQEVQARMGKWRNQSIFGIKEVKVLHKENFFVENYSVYAQNGADLNSKYTVLNNMPRLLIETVCIAGLVLYMMIVMLQGAAVTDMLPQLTKYYFLIS